MPTTSRRSFLRAISAAPLAASLNRAALEFTPRAHPLEGIRRENLTITDVKTTIMSYELPAAKRWVTAGAVIWKTDCVLVQVFTDKGIVGIGESSPYGGPDRIQASIERHVKPALIGMNPFDVEHLTCPWGVTWKDAMAWSGADAALWDIIGKVSNRPVFELLATEAPPQPHIRVYASGGVEYAWYRRPDDLIDEAVRHKEEGYTAFKFRIGTEWKNSGMTVSKFIPYLRRMREAVGAGFDLMLESNMRLSLEECLEIAPVLNELHYLWFEEPVSTAGEGAIEAHLRIKNALRNVMVSGGESKTNRFDLKEWIDRDAYDIVQPDCNVTGLTEAWHIARIAHLRNKYCCPHNWHGGLTTMANAALVAAIPNRLMLELNQTYNPFKEEIFVEPLVVRKGYMDLSRKPGFGLELKPGIAAKFPYLPGSYSRPNPELPRNP